MAVFTINYDEGNKENLNYKSIEIHYDSLKQKKMFDSGNFVKDWFDLIKFVITELSKTEIHITSSSTIDHFFMDGADKLYDKVYLNIINNEATLCYDLDDNDEDYYLYVSKDTQPTWKELKEMCI